jgi:AbrB family looped-hinge helix DNA binding protein
MICCSKFGQKFKQQLLFSVLFSLQSSDILINVRHYTLCKVKPYLTEAETVTVTSKGQVTLPSKLRKRLKIVKGEKLLVVNEGNAIKLVPVPKLSKLAGVDKELFVNRKPSEELEATRKEWTKEFDKRIRDAQTAT